MIRLSPRESRIEKKQTMVRFRLFLGNFERIANSKNEVASELYVTLILFNEHIPFQIFFQVDKT